MKTAHARAQIRKRRETDFWRAVNGSLFFLIVLCVVAVVTMAFLQQLRRNQEMQTNLDGLQKDLAGQKLLLLQQQREVKWLDQDPAYNELLSRNLGYMKEGETIVRLEDSAPSAPAVEAAAVKAAH